jgi:class 3 adenylate cyclase
MDPSDNSSDRLSPYWCEPGALRPRRSLVVYMDILGFSELTRSAYAAHGEAGLLRRVKHAVDRAAIRISPDYPVRDDGTAFRAWDVKLFTDNIVIGYPISDAAEQELDEIVFWICAYQLAMVEEGFFVRGGLAVGDLYMDRDIVFGNALLEAHGAEAVTARDPRVVLGESARILVKEHLSKYEHFEDAPHNSSVLIDSDGQWFVDYLSPAFADPDSPDLAAIQAHKTQIERNLLAHRETPRVWSKYQWAAAYHNFRCRPSSSLVTYLIDPVNYQAEPKRFSDSAPQQYRPTEVAPEISTAG